MSVITISRGSHSMGRAIAEKVAQRLGYECISREILLEASDKYNVSKKKLEKALQESPSLFENLTHEQAHFVFYIQSTLLKHVAKDNVVYHGYAGHLFLKKVSHILKVRIIADIHRRVDVLATRENVTATKALAMLKKIDNQRRKWTKRLYRTDPWDAILYDLLVKIHKFDIEDAVDLICHSVSLDHFKTTAESKKSMKDLEIACKFKDGLINKYPDVYVVSDYGNILIYTNTTETNVRKIKKLAESNVSGKKHINSVEVHNNVSPPENAV
jgi:cytidylate kinase